MKIKRLTKTAKLPTKKHFNDTGWDLYIDTIEKVKDISVPIKVSPWPYDHENSSIGYNKIASLYKVTYGIAIQPPEGYYTEIVPRSSIFKSGLMQANCVGVCDYSYRGELMSYFIRYDLDKDLPKPGDRVTQLKLHKLELVDIEEVEELDETERGVGGFGSTGK